jgi:hypothetical protein
MLNPEGCRERAEECRRKAEAMSGPRDRAKWLELADEWTKLSEPKFRPAKTADKRQVARRDANTANHLTARIQR